MSSKRLLRLNDLGKIELVNINLATIDDDGLMSSLDKERLEYLIENASDKIKIGKIDNSITEEIITKILFGDGFIIDLDTFNEAHISLPNFIQTISNGIGSFDINDTNTLTISGGEGIDVELDNEKNLILINNTNIDDTFIYESTIPSVLHTITHNLNTYDLLKDIYVQDAVNSEIWTEDICTFQMISSNEVEVYLTESSNIKVIITKK